MANFFERQEEAQRNTARLVSTYVLTVGLLILGLYTSVAFLLEGSLVFRPWVFGAVAGGIPLGLVCTYGYQLSRLRQGGHVVAQRLSGRRLDPSRTSRAGQQLINVVEEMAIAAGTPAPPVYVLPERGINAFSAGFTQDDAVIGVTRGAIDRLTRQELQGVVAHEFSHILNGDMALNLRLMSWTRGIERIRDLGTGVVWILFFSPLHLLRSYLKKTVDAVRSLVSMGILGIIILLVAGFLFGIQFLAGLFLLLGGVLGPGIAIFQVDAFRYVALIGAAGVVLGGLGSLGVRLIKAQVSREREFLADASAVQFTRNPEGLGRALLKQRDCEHSGRVRAGGIDAVRHLFFGNPAEPDGWLARWLPTPQWLSTHPPVEERIRQIDSSLLEKDSPFEQDPNEEEGSTDTDGPVSPEALIERAGTLSPAMLDQAQALHTALPDALLTAAHEPLGAVALSYALVLDDDESRRSQQLDVLWTEETPPVFDETKRLYDRVAALDRSLRLPLLEVAAPSLRELSDAQQEQLRETIRALAEADDRLTIFEFALQTIVRHYLDHLDQPEETSISVRTAGVWDDIAALLSGLARAGHEAESYARIAFERAYGPLADAHGIGSAELASPPPDALGTALDRLARTPASFRKEVLEACARCAMADGQITQTEDALLRAVAVAMGVPLPVSVSEAAAFSVATEET